MTLPINDESSGPWAALRYEFWTLERSIQEKGRLDEQSFQDEDRLQVMKGALTESAVLHARRLCELFANPEGKFDSDLNLSDLLPDWDWDKSKYKVLNELLSAIETAYGHYSEANSPYQTLNRIFWQATVTRPSAQDYADALDKVLPLLRRIIAEVESRQR